MEESELIALLGPSGSGKTTLLRIIAGLDTPDPNPETPCSSTAKISWTGGGSERRVGFVFQHYALFRHMTVFENIAFGLRVRPRKLRPREPELRRKVNELLELIQLGRWSQSLSVAAFRRPAAARGSGARSGHRTERPAAR